MELFTGDDRVKINYEKYGTTLYKLPGEILINNYDGNYNQFLGLLVEGHAKMVMYNEEGKETVITFLRPVCSFGDINFFVERNIPYTLAIIAVTPVKYSIMTKKDVSQLLKDDPEIAMFFLKSTSNKIASLVSRLHGEFFNSSLVVITEVLLAFSSINQEIRMSHSEISEAVGRNRVTVTKALLKLKDIGAIEQKKRKIVIKNQKMLQNISQGVEVIL